MIEINIDSPKIIKFDTKNGLNCKISHSIYSETKLGINLPVHYSLFMHLNERNLEGKLILPIDGNKLLGEETIKMLIEIKTIVGKCSQIGEILNNKLKSSNDKLQNETILANIFKKYEERYHKLDFMGHRNLFSDIIKSKKVEKINTFAENYNIKTVTKAFNDFILDRNKYTHGELMYWYPNRKTLLEYKNVNGETEYGEVNQNILNSYLKCYNDLNSFLDKINS